MQIKAEIDRDCKGDETMREILFRGKRVNNGEWVNGFIELHLVDGDLTQTEQHAFITYDSMDQIGKVYRDRLEVDLATVGQYTRLLDKNGVKIFEGDIVRMENGYDNCSGYAFGKVIFSTKDIGSCGCCYPSFNGSGFVVEAISDPYENSRLSFDNCYDAHLDGRIEVIGNIFDHPYETRD